LGNDKEINYVSVVLRSCSGKLVAEAGENSEIQIKVSVKEAVGNRYLATASRELNRLRTLDCV
jgi:hypothetical protein